MKKQRNVRYPINSEINIIPLLDILLILLIIFIIIPPKLIQSFEVNLPNNKIITNTINNNKFFITIEILGKGIYNLVMYNNKRINKIHLHQLISTITSKKNINSYNNTKYLIAASKDIRYNEIITILNELNKIGINSIGMITNCDLVGSSCKKYTSNSEN